MRRSSLGKLAAPLLLAGFLVLWQVYCALANPPTFILPSPILIGQTFVDIFPFLLSNALSTGSIAALGFVAGSAFGLILAVLMSLVPVIRSAVYPLVIGSQTTPKIAFAPLLIVWFGVGLLPKVIIVALLAFFPVLINTLVGLDTTDRAFLDLMRTVDARQSDVYLRVRIPAAIPFIFAGLKVALTVSVIGAIIAEWVASNAGLGWMLLYYNSTLQTPELFAVLLALVIVATGAFYALVAVERFASWEARITAGPVTRSSTVGTSDANL